MTPQAHAIGMPVEEGIIAVAPTLAPWVCVAGAAVRRFWLVEPSDGPP
jgi:hypothetical protein